MTEPRSKIRKLIPPEDDDRRSGTENMEAEPGTTPPADDAGAAESAAAGPAADPPVELGSPFPRSSQRSAAASVLPGTATSATARFYSGAGGAGSAGRAGTSLARQIEEQEALLEKEAERLRMLQEVLEKEAGRLLMVEEALTKEGVPDTSPRWQILAADKQILAAKEQGLAVDKQGLAVDMQGLAADKQRLAEIEAAARNRFRVPQYTVTTVPIPGEDAPLTVLELEQGASGQGASEDIAPPFIIDHGNMLSSLTDWVKRKIPGQVCIINGLVKTGKTTALMKVLPQLVLQHEPDALFCHLDFDEIMKPDVHAYEVANTLLVSLQAWCREAGLSVPGSTGTTHAHIRSDIRKLLEALKHSDRTIFFLFDEIQRFFQVESPDRTLFKALLQVNAPHAGGLRFVITGSGMVRTWQEIALTPTNGTSIPLMSYPINLPATASVAAKAYATDRLLKHHCAPEEVCEMRELLDHSTSIADMSQLAVLWNSAPPGRTIDSVLAEASAKYHDEFVTDMLPLLTEISRTDSKGDSSKLLRMRRLAEGTAEVDPATWLRPKSIYRNFFAFFINRTRRSDGSFVYGFPDTPFSALVTQYIDNDGRLLSSDMPNILRFRRNKQLLDELTQLVGEHVNDANKITAHPVARSEEQEELHKFYAAVESVTATHFEKYDCKVSATSPREHPGMEVLLGWSNDGLGRQIDRAGPRGLRYPHCAFLYALRCSYSHPKNRPSDVLRNIVMVSAPPAMGDLMHALRAHPDVKAHLDLPN